MISEPDADAYIELQRILDSETPFMMYEAGERTWNAEIVKRFFASGNNVIWMAERDGACIGQLFLARTPAKRQFHKAILGIGVLKAFWGNGIASTLYQTAEQWAQENSVRRIELTVNADNSSAIKLYEKLGFILEGRKQHGLYINGRFQDELLMAKLLTV